MDSFDSTNSTTCLELQPIDLSINSTETSEQHQLEAIDTVNTIRLASDLCVDPANILFALVSPEKKTLEQSGLKDGSWIVRR